MKKLIFGIILALLLAATMVLPIGALDIEPPQEEVEQIDNIFVYDEVGVLLDAHVKEMIEAAEATYHDTNIRFAIEIVGSFTGASPRNYIAQRFEDLHMAGGAKESGFLVILEYETDSIYWQASPELEKSISSLQLRQINNIATSYKRENLRKFPGLIESVFLEYIKDLKTNSVHYVNTATTGPCRDTGVEMRSIVIIITIVAFAIIIQILVPYRMPRLIALIVAEAIVFVASFGFATSCHADHGSIVLSVVSFILVVVYFIMNSAFGYTVIGGKKIETIEDSVGYHY